MTKAEEKRFREAMRAMGMDVAPKRLKGAARTTWVDGFVAGAWSILGSMAEQSGDTIAEVARG